MHDLHFLWKKVHTYFSWYQKWKSTEVYISKYFLACFEGNVDRAQQCFKNKRTLNEGLLTLLSKRFWEWRQIVSLDNFWIILPFQIRRLWLYYFYFSISFYLLSFRSCNSLRLTRSGQGQVHYFLTKKKYDFLQNSNVKI